MKSELMKSRSLPGKLFLLAVIGLLFSSVANASDLKGRFGIGLNWPGVQARYGITDKILAEGKVQFAINNQSNLVVPVGGRVYYLFKEIPGTIPLIPYAGAEFSWVFCPVLTGGYLTGSFAGLELMLNKNISIGGDAGLYWADVWYQANHLADLGLIFNAGLTYYF